MSNKPNNMPQGPGRRGPGMQAPPGKKLNVSVLKRVLKMLFKEYPVLLPITMFCIVFSAICSSVQSIFSQRIIAIIEKFYISRNWDAASKEVFSNILLLVCIYVLSLVSFFIHTQLMAIVTQGFLGRLRKRLFDKMQSLPIKFFDTHQHGDIMSHYTNDIDTLRQLISQSLPALLQSGIIVITVFSIMLWYSVWMTLVVLTGVICLITVSRKVGGGSAKFFIRQQKAVAKAEGYVQEMMNGQKVVKVFCHEDKSSDEFKNINEELFEYSSKAHAYANCLGPINMNIGNILYVLVATAGGLFLTSSINNISISGMAFQISIIIPFLNMTRQFTAQANQTTQQLNSIIMAMAGAERIFALMDEEPEVDDGYVTLVNAKYDDNGNLIESESKTGIWAWKHPHGDGTITYTKVCGDVRLNDVDFGYTPEKLVLHNIDIYAEPGQKVAFVGATGAGKTTITNLINRFYDIADGKIRYDGININKIKKGDLRRSLGIVLQETNLFTGTVMENIRYGRLDATDEECIEAAKLSGADDFITRLPLGYNTMLENNGSNLSQGQRQLIAISRAAVADPPVMILDEATSSIDTRTEIIVQKGMDSLMKGRTVFVIAHRLSTVKNSDVIMVLENGRIIERGNHDKLIAEKGTYYQLYTGAFELE